MSIRSLTVSCGYGNGSERSNAIKISCFTTITNPEIRGDLYKQAIECYAACTDEVVIVDGGSTDGSLEWVRSLNNPKIKIFYREWPQEFVWPMIGEAFQYGYEQCTGDYVLHFDLDMIVHEQDYTSLRTILEKHSASLALSFWKFQYILPDRYNLKSRLILAVNKKMFGDDIKFDGGGESDLCQPSFRGSLIKSDDVPEARLPFHNYEKISKSKKQIYDDIGRMDRAYKRHYGHYVYGKDGSEDSSYNGWLEMVIGRFNKPSQRVNLNEHPAIMQSAIKDLMPHQWGYNGFGNLSKNSYGR